jgi:hypothetical protein
MFRKLWSAGAILALTFFSVALFGQVAARYDDIAFIGRPNFQSPVTVPNPVIQVCSTPAVITNGNSCTPLATTFTDSTAATPCTNPNQVVVQNSTSCTSTGDNLGNYGFWALPNLYVICITGQGTAGLCQTKTVGTVGTPPITTFERFTETTAPTCLLGFDLVWGDSAAHRLKHCDNNGSPFQLVNAGTDVNTSDQVTATHLAAPLPTAQGGTAQNSTATFPASGVVVTEGATETLTNKTLAGTTPYNRLRANQGSALVIGDFGSLTGWGSTATVSAVSGTDSEFVLSIAATGTGQAGNPTVVLTFHDGTWTNPPICQITRGEGNSPAAPGFVFGVTATTLTIGGLLASTPIAATTYNYYVSCKGRP